MENVDETVKYVVFSNYTIFLTFGLRFARREKATVAQWIRHRPPNRWANNSLWLYWASRGLRVRVPPVVEIFIHPNEPNFQFASCMYNMKHEMHYVLVTHGRSYWSKYLYMCIYQCCIIKSTNVRVFWGLTYLFSGQIWKYLLKTPSSDQHFCKWLADQCWGNGIFSSACSCVTTALAGRI